MSPRHVMFDANVPAWRYCAEEMACLEYPHPLECPAQELQAAMSLLSVPAWSLTTLTPFVHSLSCTRHLSKQGATVYAYVCAARL